VKRTNAKRPQKTISLVPQRDRGRRDAQRDESHMCKDERSLGRNAGDESRERTSRSKSGLWLAAGSKSPRPTLRGDTVWLEMVYPAATKRPTRPTATGIKPESRLSLRFARFDCKEISSNPSKILTGGPVGVRAFHLCAGQTCRRVTHAPVRDLCRKPFGRLRHEDFRSQSAPAECPSRVKPLRHARRRRQKMRLLGLEPRTD